MKRCWLIIILFICIQIYCLATFLKPSISRYSQDQYNSHLNHSTGRWRRVINRVSSYIRRKNKEPKNNRSPLRDVSFWLRTAQIYSSYKFSQLKNGVKMPKFLSNKKSMNQTWSEIHEINSNRMIRLCLGLRGFYLKTGQFLGTRYDFMPPTYTRKLSQLHDNVPPMSASEAKKYIEKELNGTLEEYFSSIDLSKPIGSASIAQVHQGIWKSTGEKVAVKVQFPNAERLMKKDLRNLRRLAEFLQKTEFKFDLLSAIIELQKQIGNEFDFVLEAKNMNMIRKGLQSTVPEVVLPKPIWVSKRVLVMSFIEGPNLGKLAEFRDKAWNNNQMPRWLKQKFAMNLLNTLSKAWGEQIFGLKAFNADPHPGNICLCPDGKVGLLDWGQVKRIPDDLLLRFSSVVDAIERNSVTEVVQAFFRLGVEVADPRDISAVHAIAVTMLDTRRVPGAPDPSTDPSAALLRANLVRRLPSELYFVVRTVQLLRGIAHALDVDYSLATQWAPRARLLLRTSAVDTARLRSSLREGTAAEQKFG